MNAIAARIRDYDNCHDGDVDAAADEIERLEKVIDAQKETIEWLDSWIKENIAEIYEQKETIENLKATIRQMADEIPNQ